TKTESPDAALATAPRASDSRSDHSRTAESPPMSTPSRSTISPEPSSRTATPVTAGAKDPMLQRNENARSDSTGTPEIPVTVKSLRPATALAASRNDCVTLRLAWWIAATAAAPTATPTTGRTSRSGCLRAGPVTSARKTRRNAFKDGGLYTGRERVSHRADPDRAVCPPGAPPRLRRDPLPLALDRGPFCGP